MFDEGAKLDDILNVLHPPTFEKNRSVSDAAIRYDLSKLAIASRLGKKHWNFSTFI